MLNLYFVETPDKNLTFIQAKYNFYSFKLFVVLHRGNGYKINQGLVDKLEDNTSILTNDETLLNHFRFWNEETKTYNIFKLSKDGEWKPLSDFAYSNLRKANDLTKIFWCGMFDEE